MMDISLFRDPAYALAIGTICAVFFSIYGMLLLTTQFLQNVRGYTPEQTGLMHPAVQRDGDDRVAAGRAPGRQVRRAHADPRRPRDPDRSGSSR